MVVFFVHHETRTSSKENRHEKSNNISLCQLVFTYKTFFSVTFGIIIDEDNP